ncbi:MAG: crossover junction endodeoxyribonuclease RuvC [Deltaproteobacteria bacterium]|nr:crossover junction endodeoxyribonuclease RuvC [Deltaproteobacteria bacterium]
MGVDPGSVRTGFGIIHEEQTSLHYLACGVVRTSSSSPISSRLKRIYSELKIVMERYRPDVVSIENIFVARNVQSALKLGHARGVAILAAVNQGLEVVEYTPAEVKKTLAGSGRAEKSQVQHMVKALLSLAELPEPYDASDALALAICHSHSREMNLKMKVLAR